MAMVIVNSSVWNRIHEYYDNVETKYPNTWNINDTIAQISKIQWVISNFENVCFWGRESIILYWKRMGWKETWHKSSPWHFAFEYKRVNEQDYIFIQDAEHQDDIKESSFNLKSKIIENKLYNTMNNTRNRVRLTESQLHNVIKESVKQVLSELDWKTYANAAKKRYSQKDFDKFHDLRRASEDAFNKKYGYNDEWDADLQHGGERKVYMQGTGENYSEPTLRASKDDRYPSLYGAYKSVGSTLSHNKKGDYVYGSHHQSCDDGHWSSNNTDDFDFGPDEVFKGKYGAAKREFDRYDNGNYEYEPNGRGWHLKDNMGESIRRAIRKVLH